MFVSMQAAGMLSRSVSTSKGSGLLNTAARAAAEIGRLSAGVTTGSGANWKPIYATVAKKGAKPPAESAQSQPANPGLTKTVRTELAKRDVFADRPVYEKQDVLEERDVFALRGVYEDRAVMGEQDVFETRDVYETRNVYETRAVFEDQARYETKLEGTRDLSGFNSAGAAGITSNAAVRVSVGDGQVAEIKFVTTNALGLPIDIPIIGGLLGGGTTKISVTKDGATTDFSYTPGAAGSFQSALTQAFSSVGGLSASLTQSGKLSLTTTGAQSLTLAENSGSTALSKLGLQAGTTQASVAGYDRVQVGTEQVVIGTEQVVVGAESVKIGTQSVQVGTEQFLVGLQNERVGSETVKTGERLVQSGTQRVKVGTEFYSIDRIRFIKPTDDPSAMDEAAPTKDPGLVYERRIVGFERLPDTMLMSATAGGQAAGGSGGSSGSADVDRVKLLFGVVDPLSPDSTPLSEARKAYADEDNERTSRVGTARDKDDDDPFKPKEPDEKSRVTSSGARTDKEVYTWQPSFTAKP